MIEINLLPEELNKKQGFQAQTVMSLLKQSFAVALASCVLFFLVFQGLIIFNLCRLKLSESKWRSLQAQKKRVDDVKNAVLGYRALQNGILLVSAENSEIARRLYTISAFMPRDIWLEELFLGGSALRIKGSCVLLSAGEAAQINKLLELLKENIQINKGLNKLQLGAITKRKLGAIEVADFTISSKK